MTNPVQQRDELTDVIPAFSSKPIICEKELAQGKRYDNTPVIRAFLNRSARYLRTQNIDSNHFSVTTSSENQESSEQLNLPQLGQ